ncbi:MAG: ATP synthase F1 subunit epsilon [Proteobacteria bacterium]|nr:ATP synthase F1 subunit epsilon [Pseudomonadota bacterium]
MNLVTPRGVVVHQDTNSILAPGELGAFELLPGHVAMLAALKPGVLIIGGKAKYAVSSGYLRIDPANKVEILVEQAVASADVDVELAKKDLATSEAELGKWDKPLDGDHASLVQRVGFARARLDAVSH